MKSDEIRSSYLKFFESKGHKIYPSSSLIPHGDPTLLFTSAGMVQFKPYYTGKATPQNTRATTCQKCFRTTDIECVGDATHLTFFEMLGNFSFGDYFKKEAIPWAWEYVTEHLKIPESRLWITIFRDDDDAFKIWRQIGIPEDKIVRLGEKDNFWGPAGNSGPCGPCSEIHYDLGVEKGCGKPDCKPGCDCKRFTEIWNLVFPQFFQDERGKRTNLAKPGIDTGMGLERVAAVMQGKNTVYETDLFTPLLHKISELSGVKYAGKTAIDNAMRIVVEHGRAVSFLLADGVMPGKDGRGYVLRRLLRRAEYFGETIAKEKPFLTAVASEVINQMGSVYPELTANRQHILNVIESEVENFRKALPIGRGILLDTIHKLEPRKDKSRVFPGTDAFILHDTYGFPIDLTKEIAASHGFAVDMDSFEQEMEKQRERAKASHKFVNAGTGITDLQLNLPPTKFVGYERLTTETRILAIIAEGESEGVIVEGEGASLVLEATPFYGEMGGQVGDTGIIKATAGTFKVSNTVHSDNLIVHIGKVTAGSITVESIANAEVDMERRLDIARNHTATHLLQNALRQIMGNQIQQRGSLVTPERLRFDFSQMVALTQEEIQKVQSLVNDRIRRNYEVYAIEMTYKDAIKEGAIALFDEKYGDTVRTLRVGRPPISVELCGGTHVQATGQIGYLQILSETSVGSGLRRIEAVTGRGAEQYLTQVLNERREIAQAIGAGGDNFKEKINATLEALETEKKLRQSIEKDLARKIAESLLEKAEEITGGKMIAAHVDPLSSKSLLEMTDYLREKLKSAVITLGTVSEGKSIYLTVVTQDLVNKGYNAGDIIKNLAMSAGGRGGGKPTMAQASSTRIDKIDEAIDSSRLYVRGKIPGVE